MFEWLAQLEAWHWLIFGLLLLGAEAIGTAGFLLGAAASALLMTLLLFIAPDITWQTQLVVFGLQAVLLSVLYWKFFKPFNQQTADHQTLNQRSQHLIGKQWVLVEAVIVGENHIQIGDTYWKVFSEQAFPAGTPVKVSSADAMRLIITAA